MHGAFDAGPTLRTVGAIRCALAFGLVVAGCRSASGQGPAGSAPAAAFERVSLARSGCLGSCPAYAVTVTGDGTVGYEGGVYVKTTGRQHGRLSPADLVALRGEFERAGFFTVEVSPPDPDVPAVTIACRAGGRERSITFDHAPESVKRLVVAFERIVGIERWIGTPEERHRLSPGGAAAAPDGGAVSAIAKVPVRSPACPPQADAMRCVWFALRRSDRAHVVAARMRNEGVPGEEHGGGITARMRVSAIERFFGTRLRWSVTGASASDRLVCVAGLPPGAPVPARYRAEVREVQIDDPACE